MLPFHIFLCCCMQCSACRRAALGCAARVVLPGCCEGWCRQPCHPCCMQHSSAQMGVTAFAAVLLPLYVLQQNLSATFILRIAFIKIASISISWLLRFSTGLSCHWIDLKITGYVSRLQRLQGCLDHLIPLQHFQLLCL